jgi:hypothetical protein
MYLAFTGYLDFSGGYLGIFVGTLETTFDDGGFVANGAGTRFYLLFDSLFDWIILLSVLFVVLVDFSALSAIIFFDKEGLLLTGVLAPLELLLM